MDNKPNYDRVILVSGYFTGQRKRLTTYTFHDSEAKKEFRTECHGFVPDDWKAYAMLVRLENQMKTYRVLRIVEELKQPKKLPNRREESNASAQKEYVGTIKSDFNEWVHFEAAQGLRKLFNIGCFEKVEIPFRLICYLREEKWQELVYDSQPFVAHPDVLAEWLSTDHPLVQESRVWKAMIDCTKRERSIWLCKQQLGHVIRIADFENIKRRMVRNGHLTENLNNGKLALGWAAKMARDCQIDPHAKFVDSPLGSAQRTIANTNLSAATEFSGNRMASVDRYVDEKVIVATMMNDKPWVKDARYADLIKLRNASDCTSIKETPNLRIGLRAVDNPIRKALAFLEQQNIRHSLFVFTYDDELQALDIQQAFEPIKARPAIVKPPRRLGDSATPRILLLTENENGSLKSAIDPLDGKRFDETKFFMTGGGTSCRYNEAVCFLSCREYDLPRLPSNAFQAIVLFVQKETHYRWLAEAERVADRKLLLVVETEGEGKRIPLTPSGSPMESTEETAGASASISQPSPGLPTILDLMNHIGGPVSHNNESAAHSSSVNKRARTERDHTVVYERCELPDARDLETLKSFFESKVPPQGWSRRPSYKFNKRMTRFVAECGVGCGSKNKHKSIYEMMLCDGRIVQFTDLRETSHGEKCRPKSS